MSESEDLRTPSPLQEVLVEAVRRVLGRGTAGITRVAKSSRKRVEIRQLQKDLDHFWVRLGKTAYHLNKAGDLDHPALTKAIARIDELEARIERMRHQEE